MKTFKELFAGTGIEPTTDENGGVHYNFNATLKKESIKTAMQELLENLQKSFDEKTYPIRIDATYFLEKEKEQIKNVFEHCWNHAKWNGEYDIKDMEDYLKNYNQNNK